jgi:hypothetical protein
MRMSSALSTRLYALEELRITINSNNHENLKKISWPRFYQLFPSVKALRTGGVNNYCVARTLHPDNGEYDNYDYLAFFPALEEIDLGKNSLTTKSENRSQVAAFQSFVSARQRAGRPVKVFFSP